MLRVKKERIRTLAFLLSITMLFPGQISYAAATENNIEPEITDEAVPESETAVSAATEKLVVSSSDGQPEDDGKIYVEGNLYNGYYMDNAGLLYIVSNGIPKSYTGVVPASTKYYCVNLPRVFGQKTLYVNGKLYTGYYWNRENKMYYAKKGSLIRKTGIVGAKTKYYSDKEGKVRKLKKKMLYVKGKLYTGYYLSKKNKMYYVKKGSLTRKTGTMGAKTRYYSGKGDKVQKLKKKTLYVDGKLYTGYYLSRKNKMYRVKKGLLALKTGTVPAKTKYYNGRAGKTRKLKNLTLYVKGKLYTGYYLGSKNIMYSAKKGVITPVSALLDSGTKYYSYKGKKTQKLSSLTLYVAGKLYTGYYLDGANKMHHVQNGACTIVNTMLPAGTAYYNHNTGTMCALPGQMLYIYGKAMEGMSAESMATLQRAQAVVAGITNDSMTPDHKLRVCYDYVKQAYSESKVRVPHYRGMDWPVVYANDMFLHGSGNCCSYAAAFAYMAKAIGYDEVYCCNSGGHGWAEIDGLVYDPEWSKWHHAYDYFALSYDAKTDQDYKGAIGARQPWMRIKI